MVVVVVACMMASAKVEVVDMLVLLVPCKMVLGVQACRMVLVLALGQACRMVLVQVLVLVCKMAWV